MKLPFHAVQVHGDILFAARGGSLHSFKLTDGSHISCCWKYPAEPKTGKSLKNEENEAKPVSENPTPAPSQDEQGPPAKRARVDNGDVVMEDAGKETLTENGKGEEVSNGGKNKKPLARPGQLSQLSERPMVIIMSATQDGHYLIAVTSDKSIWVFEHDGQGQLKQLSRRTMPKRPCSIVITPDNQDILSADKFGDVYSLPLLPSPDWKPETAAATAAIVAASPSSADTSEFKPQATELTVHTKRNRQALLDQQISRTNPKAQRGSQKKVEAEPFERYLLLGHVSLLTAVALGHDEDDQGQGQGRRRYILTADRDEHIRVSRGTREQSYVIENFCLGHDDFVNRLCIPDGMGQLLVSAGGDPDVFVWRWKEGRLLAKAPLLQAVKEVVPQANKVAVTGLCCWPADSAEEGVRIVAICERVPAVFMFILQASGSLEFSRTISLPGNPMDIAIVSSEKAVVAVDPGHESASGGDLKKSLLKVEHINGEYKASDDLVQDISDLGDGETDVSEEELQKLLYSAETLRKMESEDGADAE